MSKFHTPEKVRLARKLRKQGQSFKKIASALKISHATVWRWNTDLAQHYLKHTSTGLLREKAKILGQKTVSLLPRVLNKPELKALVAILL